MTENKSILSPEEANQPVTFGSLEMILKQVIESIGNKDEVLWQSSEKCLEMAIDKLVDRINNEHYERCRFEHFIISLIGSIHHVTEESVWENYKQYCKEFDKLNKKDSKESDTQ